MRPALALLLLALVGCNDNCGRPSPYECRQMCAPSPVARYDMDSCVCVVPAQDGGR